jgi:hypothetical protein
VWNVALVKGAREEQGSQRTLTETDQTSYASTKKPVVTVNKVSIMLKEKFYSKTTG